MLNSTNEKWLPIKDYPMYRISSYGRVFSIRTNRILKYKYKLDRPKNIVDKCPTTIL